MAQLMPLPLTVSCFSKIQIGFTFLVPARPGSPGQRAVKRVCVCVCAVFLCYYRSSQTSIVPRVETIRIYKSLFAENLVATQILTQADLQLRH